MTMIFELSQRFYFEAAHTLERRIDTETSRRIHGHTYQAEITVAGPRDPVTGMVVDLGVLREAIAGVRKSLDHAFLDEVPDLPTPTVENLCAYIAKRFEGLHPPLSSVRVWREASGDACVLHLRADG